VKFKPEEYKNYTIQYLEMPGFFRIFLGKMFKNLEKPFFTYIEDFVVFSNSPDALKNTIDNYIAGNTLDKNESFVDFKDEFSTKSNIAVFVRTPQIYENLYYYSTAKDRKDLKENKEFILSFEKIGFQLVSEEDMFKTTLLAQHNPNAIIADELEKIDNEVSSSNFREEVASMSFKINLDASFLENDTIYKEYYPDTEKLMFEGQINNGAITGIWKSYYKSGNIKNSVNYEDGKVSGEAYYWYDSKLKVKRAAATFEDDLMTGFYYEFYENGTQKAKIEYDEGKAEGDAEFFYPNGKLKIEAEYKDNEKHGKWVYFDEKGEKIGKEKWKKGVKVR
jgi:antitoxin component YwqK of YwqJK toxin-antitoxin module